MRCVCVREMRCQGARGRVYSMMVTLVVLLTAASCLVSGTTTTSSILHIREGPSSYPSDLDACLLLERDMGVPSKVQCASACLNTPSCYLFCVTGTVCSLFKARVRRHWQGSADPDARTFHKCFSTLPDDETEMVGPPYSSTLASGSSTINAFDGYFCSDQSHCFVSKPSSHHWWQFDHTQTQTISQVTLQQHPSSLLDLQVRIGFVTNSGYNAKFGPLSPSPDGLTVFNISPPATGPVFTITGPAGVMTICDISIIPQ